MSRNVTVLQSSSRPALVTGKVWADGRCGWSNVRESRETGLEAIAQAVTAAQAPRRTGGMDYSIGNPTHSEVLKFVSPLGSSSVSNFEIPKKPRLPRGSKGLTAHGKKLVFNAIDYLQWRFGKKHLTFCTVTLPSVTNEQGEQCVAEWSKIVELFTKNLRRKLNACGLPNWIVGATEIQELRSRSSAFAPLHFHCVYVGRLPGKHWGITHTEVREAWRRSVVSRVPSAGDLDYSATENVQAVKRSASNYLSKYVSKGRQPLGNVESATDIRLPSSWYSCTRVLSRFVRGVVCSGVAVGSVLSGLRETDFIYRRRIEVTTGDGNRITVGWAGLLRPSGHRLIPKSVYVPAPEVLALQSQFCIPRVHHEGFSYLFSVAANV